jgi:hypothetical protein
MNRSATTYYGFLRFKNREALPIIATQLNGVYFNDGRITVELNKYPPRDIHLEQQSEVTFKYNPQLKQRLCKNQQPITVDSHSHEKNEQPEANNQESNSQQTENNPEDSDTDFDILSIESVQQQRKIVEKKNQDIQVDTVTEEIKKFEETVKKMKQKISIMEEEIEEANQTKQRLDSTIKDQAKRIGDMGSENQRYRGIINKLKLAVLSSD